jgi:hypothetical protein
MLRKGILSSSACNFVGIFIKRKPVQNCNYFGSCGIPPGIDFAIYLLTISTIFDHYKHEELILYKTWICPWARLEGIWGTEGIDPLILNFGTRRTWTVIFELRPLQTQGKTPRYPCIGGWVGPTSGLDAVRKRQKSHLYRKPVDTSTLPSPPPPKSHIKCVIKILSLVQHEFTLKSGPARDMWVPRAC